MKLTVRDEYHRVYSSTPKKIKTRKDHMCSFCYGIIPRKSLIMIIEQLVVNDNLTHSELEFLIYKQRNRFHNECFRKREEWLSQVEEAVKYYKGVNNDFVRKT